MTEDVGKSHLMDEYKFDKRSSRLSSEEKFNICYDMIKKFTDGLDTIEPRLHPEDVLQILLRSSILQTVNALINITRNTEASFLKIFAYTCNEIEKEYNISEKILKEREDDKKKEEKCDPNAN
jgi:hypothetical protein